MNKLDYILSGFVFTEITDSKTCNIKQLLSNISDESLQVLVKNFLLGNQDYINNNKTEIEKSKIFYTKFKEKYEGEDSKNILSYIFKEIDKLELKGKFQTYGLLDPIIREPQARHIMRSKYNNFNKYLCGGFTKKTWIGIEGKTGSGKTTTMISIASDMLTRGYNVFYVNLEMDIQDLGKLMLASLIYDVNYNNEKINHNIIDKNYVNTNIDFCDLIINTISSMKLGKFAQIVNGDYDRLNISDLEKIILYEEEENNIKYDIIIIDYLYLLAPVQHGNKVEQGYEKQQRLSQDAHKMAQRNNWCVLSVFQKNRTDGTAGAYNSQFDMDAYFTFTRLENGLMEFTPVKTRKYDGFKENFYMKYDSDHKVYYEYEKPLENYTWKNVIDLPIIHNNLCPSDIVKLCEKFNIEIKDKSRISKYKKEKGYDLQREGCSKIDYNSINLDNIFNKISKENLGNIDPEVNLAIDLMTNDLFKI